MPILCFSGRKQSGKGSAVNFIHALGFTMIPGLQIVEKAYVNNNGELVVDTAEEGERGFDVNSRDPECRAWMAERVWPFMRSFSFADPLKEMCVDILGLTEEQVYGTNEQKNSLVPHLLWENFPIKYKGKKGPMTSREVQQYVGTDIYRQFYPDCFADSTIRRIKQSNSFYSLLGDCRFPNEVNKTQEAGGKVIRFTRSVFNDDHYSEHALDEDKFDWSKFDAVIDNQNLTIDETNNLVFHQLVLWDWIDVKVQQ